MLTRTLTLSLALAFGLGLSGCVIEVKDPGDTGIGGTTDGGTTDGGTTDGGTTDGGTTDGGTTGDSDLDGDGYDDIAAGGDDCDDSDPAVNPGAEEIPYDGVDNDCDAMTVDDDLDGDGYTFDVDCDDENAASYPGAAEVCDGVQNDCDTEWTSDEGLVTHEDGAGMLTDLSASFAGEAEAPADAVIPADGTVRICGGTYFANISVDAGVSAVDIVGVEGWEATIIDGAGAGPALNVEAEGQTVSASGLTLSGGAGLSTEVGRADYLAGGGVRCAGGAILNLSEVNITGNSAEIGGGVLAIGGCDLSVSSSVIDGNQAVSDWGGGVALDGSSASLSDVTVSNNSANRTGGGIDAFDSTLAVSGGMVDGNTSFTGTGGGLSLSGGSEATLDGVIFSGNAANSPAGGAGGAVAMDDSSAAITGGSLEGNAAGNGGAVAAEGGSSLMLDGVSVGTNTATNGGGLFIKGSFVEVSGGLSSGNTASGGGGGALVAEDGTLSVSKGENSKNGPDDVQTGIGPTLTGSYDFPGVRSYNCDDQGCIDSSGGGTTDGTATTDAGTGTGG